MDHRAVVNRRRPPLDRRAAGTPAPACAHAPSAVLRPLVPPGDAQPVTCAQAVFTSIRTPVGEGYRLVAASPGLTVQEKAEITRRAPSHGALRGANPDVLGLLGYALPSGRYCVCASRNAGQEYTARGGERVWTNLVVLEPETYHAFGCNPIRVHGALQAASRPTATPLPPTLDPLVLRAWNGPASRSAAEASADLDAFVRLAGALLAGESWVVWGTAPSIPQLEWVFDVVPLGRRGQLSISAGLTFCLARSSTLAFVAEDRAAVERVIRGQPVRWCDLDQPEEPVASAFDDWLAFVRHWANEGRLAAVARLAARVEAPADPDALRRVGELYNDRDFAFRADEEEKSALREKYAGFVAANELEQELLAKLQAELVPPPEPAPEEPPA